MRNGTGGGIFPRRISIERAPRGFKSEGHEASPVFQSLLRGRNPRTGGVVAGWLRRATGGGVDSRNRGDSVQGRAIAAGDGSGERAGEIVAGHLETRQRQCSWVAFGAGAHLSGPEAGGGGDLSFFAIRAAASQVGAGRAGEGSDQHRAQGLPAKPSWPAVFGECQSR